MKSEVAAAAAGMSLQAVSPAQASYATVRRFMSCTKVKEAQMEKRVRVKMGSDKINCKRRFIIHTSRYVAGSRTVKSPPKRCDQGRLNSRNMRRSQLGKYRSVVNKLELASVLLTGATLDNRPASLAMAYEEMGGHSTRLDLILSPPRNTALTAASVDLKQTLDIVALQKFVPYSSLV
ncbi:hypothetical protein Ciccas_003796 [Cichlidogyrus casuarinus]|uniref:Uncharacterized protein n=1 Tax=Cichlidogyrus casuarinus TaxID=1844966 RepID=A0ABD2QDF7_9PLAT